MSFIPMLKKHKSKLLLVVMVIFSMITMYGYTPSVEAASLYDAKDTLSTSVPGATGTSTIIFKMGSALSAGEFVSIDFGSFTGDAEANVTCPTNSSASTTPNSEVGCEATGAGLLADTDQTITVSGVTNPGTKGAYTITVTTYNTSYVEKESVSLKVYIIESVTVSATVDTSLTFSVLGVDAGEVINGVTTNATSTATTTPFGQLSTTASTTVGQELNVLTNAGDGFSVTVQQTDELTTAGGANINSFNNSPDDTGSTTPAAWTAPAGILDSTYTYGHMGLTSDDESLDPALWSAETNPFNVGSGAEYVGLNNTAPLQVMYHTGPADGSTASKGAAKVAYTVEINPMQEAGDYTTTLTYICTPTY